MNRPQAERPSATRSPQAAPLGTAEFAAAGERRVAPGHAAPARDESAGDESHDLAPLFPSEAAEQFRGRWNATQIGFVDDPRQAVQQADELVAQVMRSLAQSFAHERSRLESQMAEGQHASTEDLRVALRRYRSFFERLLRL